MKVSEVRAGQLCKIRGEFVFFINEWECSPCRYRKFINICDWTLDACYEGDVLEEVE